MNNPTAGVLAPHHTPKKKKKKNRTAGLALIGPKFVPDCSAKKVQKTEARILMQFGSVKNRIVFYTGYRCSAKGTHHLSFILAFEHETVPNSN